MTDIAVVGSLNTDFVVFAERLPRAGETCAGRELTITPGGKGANQAYAAAKLGARVAMSGRVGSDARGAALKTNLEAQGCDTSRIREVAGQSGIALVTIAPDGANSIVIIPGANAAYTPAEWKRDAEIVADAKVVLLQLESPLETVIAAAAAAKAAGARVILDPAPAQPLSGELLRSVDILTPNEVELATLVGSKSSRLGERELVDAAAALRPAFRGTLIAKLGGRGALLASGNTLLRFDAVVVKAIDTTAAGDVFNAALAVALVDGQPFEQACSFALHAAAISVTRTGAQSSAPSRGEVDAGARAAPQRPQQFTPA